MAAKCSWETLALCFHLVLLACTVGDVPLGGAIIDPPSEPHLSRVVIPLRLREVVLKNTLCRSFTAMVSVGSPPQLFEVLVDTGSNRLWLPFETCRAPACLAHARYNPLESSTAQPLEPLHVKGGFASGELLGHVVRDEVCIGVHSGSRICSTFDFLAADHESDFPFQHAQFDGILGLGLPSLSATAGATILEEFPAYGLRMFSLRLGSDGGELVFASDEENLHGSGILWVPLSPMANMDGYWIMQVTEVRMGGEQVHCARNLCMAAVDSGAGFMVGPLWGVYHIKEAFRSAGNCVDVERLPELEFELQGAAGPVTLTLSHEEYLDRRRTRGTTCTLAVQEMDGRTGVDLWLLGQPLLRKYAVAFDISGRRAGFATKESFLRHSKSGLSTSHGDEL